jgi:ABC-type amino acid transport substrate-binding protein
MMGQDLAAGKYDAICASLINMPRAMLVDSCDPFVFVPTYAYIRADDNRFQSIKDFNNPAYTISGQEGTAVTTTAREKFPAAKFHMLTNTDLAEMFVTVATRKADVAFMIPSFFDAYNKNNPGVLKQLSDTPLQTFSFSFGLAPEQQGLKSLFNNSLHRLIVSGELEEIYAEFDPANTLMRPNFSALSAA